MELTRINRQGATSRLPKLIIEALKPQVFHICLLKAPNKAQGT